MSLRDYLQVLRQRWWWVAVSLLIGLLAAGALTLLSTPMYAATTTFYINAPGVSGGLDQAYSGSLLAEQKAKSYPELIESERIRADVNDLLGSPVRSGQITASSQLGSVVLTVVATDPSPQRAMDIANAVGTSFSKFIFELERFPGAPRAPIQADVIKTAALPSAPSSPVPTTNLAIGALLGLTAGVTAAFVRQSLDTSVRSAADLKRLTSVPVLGALPYDRAIKVAPLTLQGSPSASVDFYRQLRTTMELLDPERRCKRVAVASSVAGEGRTTLLCNLASAFGRADFRVLVVDADLRRPRVAKYLGLSSDVGLTNVALGDAPLDNAIQPWDRAVDVLTSGPVPADPGEVLASPAMGALLEEIGRRYDLVLIDTPPLRPVADGRIIATRCDASLLVIRRGRTNQAQVHEAVEELETWGARFLGIVLNMGHAPAAYGVPAAKPSRRRSLDGVSAWASLPASSGANAQDNASTNRNPGDSRTRD